jgi:hypothetical protein
MNEVDPRYGDVSWYHEGRRCQERDIVGNGQRVITGRCGTITGELWSGYVPVEWDDGTIEDQVHIRDIRQI